MRPARPDASWPRCCPLRAAAGAAAILRERGGRLTAASAAGAAGRLAPLPVIAGTSSCLWPAAQPPCDNKGPACAAVARVVLMALGGR